MFMKDFVFHETFPNFLQTFTVPFSESCKPTSPYLFKINNGNNRIICEICSELIIKAPEHCQAVSIDLAFMSLFGFSI